MKTKISGFFFLAIAGTVIFYCCNTSQQRQKEELGKLIFLDETLSEPSGQSCATCHGANEGFADTKARSVSEGAENGLFGERNAMTITYAAFVPSRYFDPEKESYVGGLFWDGRSTNLCDQAGKPFLNPLEMANPDSAVVVAKVKKAKYYKKLIQIYGESQDMSTVFGYITDALAAYEASSEINSFSSKYDLYLSGKTELTAEELKGLDLFTNKGKCASCHILDNDSVAGKPLFTDHTYDNLGIPKNPQNPFYTLPPRYNPEGDRHVDLGLGAIVGKASENGKFRVPTLRNIAKTAPYGHNGYFTTLRDIVRFYNKRDVPGAFPAAEYPETVNHTELGNLGLTDQEEYCIVLFMNTLTDQNDRVN